MREKIKPIIVIAIVLLVGFVVGVFSQRYITLYTPETFADQQLTIPNARVLNINTETIVIQDKDGKQAVFPLHKDFLVVATSSESTSASVLKVNDYGSIMLQQVGKQYQAFRFFLSNSTQ